MQWHRQEMEVTSILCSLMGKSSRRLQMKCSEKAKVGGKGVGATGFGGTGVWHATQVFPHWGSTGRALL